MAVREESAPGVALNEAEENALHLGLQRLSKAVELRRLGHPELADALRALAEADNSLAEQQAAVLAREALHKSRGINSNLRTETISVRDLVGGIVTRVGHINAPELSRADQDTLDRLGFRPMFAGVERNLLEALIQGNSKNMSRILNASARKDGMARGGTWVVPLGRKREQRKLRRIGRDSVASEK
jgi:hypothetical protein